MTKKCYACILTSKDKMKEILQLCDDPANLSRIKSVASRFLADFGDVDPDWRPGAAKPAAQAPQPAQAVQTAPTASAVPSGNTRRQPPVPAITSYASDPRTVAPLF